MTSPTTPEGGDPMELDEVALMQRFDSAVADLAPDVTSLVEGGHLRGNAVRRRRRMSAGAGAVVAAAVTVGVVALAQGVFDHKSAGPTTPNPTGVEQLVPATPRGMAAAAIDQLGLGTPEVVAGQRPTSDGQSSGDQLMVGMVYQLDTAKVEVDVYTSSDVSVWKDVGCDQLVSNPKDTVSCDTTTLPDGMPAIHALIRAGSGTDGKTVYQSMVSVRRPDQVVLVTEAALLDKGDATALTEASMPIPRTDLIRLVMSPSVGSSTTAGYNDAGEKIEDFKDSLTTSSSTSSGSRAVTEHETSTPQKAGGN